MLEIGVLIYGIYTLITGKFSLGGGKKLEGWRGRITGAILLNYIFLAFIGGVVLAITENESLLTNQFGALLFSVVLLLITVVAAYTVGHLLYRGQEAERVAKVKLNRTHSEPNSDFAPDSNPYRSPRH